MLLRLSSALIAQKPEVVAGLCGLDSCERVLCPCLRKAPVSGCLILPLLPHSFLLPVYVYSLSHSGIASSLSRAAGYGASAVGPQGQWLRWWLSQLRRFRAELQQCFCCLVCISALGWEVKFSLKRRGQLSGSLLSVKRLCPELSGYRLLLGIPEEDSSALFAGLACNKFIQTLKQTKKQTNKQTSSNNRAESLLFCCTNKVKPLKLSSPLWEVPLVTTALTHGGETPFGSVRTCPAVAMCNVSCYHGTFH